MLACAIMASSLLVEITPASHAVRLDIVYATARNFTGAPVYRRPACFLHPDAAAWTGHHWLAAFTAPAALDDQIRLVTLCARGP